MICTSCGFDNPEGMNFCGRCSTPLSYLPTGVITYLFTDLEGSTQLWQEHPGEMSGVLARHDALLTSVNEEHGGMVVRSRDEGDSLFAVFVRARDAAAAACAVSSRNPGRWGSPSRSGWLSIPESLSYGNTITMVRW